MDKPIFIINGKPTSGKDTFVSFVNQAMEGVFAMSSVDPIKEIAKAVGWTGAKTEKDRKFLSDLKMLSTEYNDFPFRYIGKAITLFNSTKNFKVMFIHVREPSEIKRIADRYGAKTILIRNPNVEPILSNEADANVENYEYDYVIDNDGSLAELALKASLFVNQVIKGV
jgi:hypothetical protein